MSPDVPILQYFHGGPPRLYVGDWILPPSETGLPSSRLYGNDMCRADRVYVTTAVEAAAIFASFHPSGKGQIYRVRPEGDIKHDPDCSEPGLSFECERAEVLEVIRITKRQRAYVRQVIAGGGG